MTAAIATPSPTRTALEPAGRNHRSDVSLAEDDEDVDPIAGTEPGRTEEGAEAAMLVKVRLPSTG
jgi:hypothetical protein